MRHSSSFHDLDKSWLLVRYLTVHISLPLADPDLLTVGYLRLMSCNDI